MLNELMATYYTCITGCNVEGVLFIQISFLQSHAFAWNFRSIRFELRQHWANIGLLRYLGDGLDHDRRRFLDTLFGQEFTGGGHAEWRSSDVVAVVLDRDEVISGDKWSVAHFIAFLHVGAIHGHFRWAVDSDSQWSTACTAGIYDKVRLLTYYQPFAITCHYSSHLEQCQLIQTIRTFVYELNHQ